MMLLLSFLTGILVGALWSGAGIYIVILVGLILSSLSVRRYVWCIVLVLMGYSLSYTTLSDLETERTRVGDMVGWEATTHTIVGQAKELLSVSEFSHRYRVTIHSLGDTPIEPLDVALIFPPNLSLKPGDHVTAVGRFSFPRDTADYLAEKQLWYRGMVAEFRSFHNDKKPPQKYGAFIRLRGWLDDRLTSLFPPRGQQVLSGIILGQKNTLDPVLRENLKASGLMHIMVVSGSNVMMLIIFLSLFLRAFHPWIRILCIGCVIFGFVLLVGGDTPVWRAALMGVIGYSASIWGFRFSPLLLPLGVASILALINPLSLAYDIGFQLSFLSVICIISFGRYLTKWFSFAGAFFDEALSLTVAATLGTLPITLYYFGTFSLISPLANLFAAPAIPLLMYGGIVSMFVSAWSETLGYLLGYIPWMAVTYLLSVIELFGTQTWSLLHLDMGVYKGEFLFASLSLLVIFISCVYRRENQKLKSV